MAGCAEDAQQRQAREAVQAHLAALPGAHYRGGGVHCTRNARVIVSPFPTNVYLCNVPTRDERCDTFRVRRRGRGSFTVRLLRRDVDCVLPAS